MSNFDLHEFNILSQRHNYFMTNNRINGFPVLKESSIFLKKILAQRTSNSAGKKIPMNLLNEKDLDNFRTNKKIYHSPPIITNKKINNDNNININIKRIKPNISRNINNPKSNYISPSRTGSNTILLNRIITPNYYKIPINTMNRLSKSPNIGRNISINNEFNDEVKVLNIGGKKIFASNSFNGFRDNYTQNNNTPIKNENSELFRNYDELKKKKDEIYRRKMKRDSSAYGKQLLKLEKDKEIKEQRINNDKLRIIPLKKKLITRYNSKEKIKNNRSNEINNNNDNKIKSHNIIVLQKSKNLYNKKNFKTNNIFISKNTKNKDKDKEISNTNINNNNHINQKIKQNLEYLRVKKNKSRTKNNNNSEQINNINNINNIKIFNGFKSRNKKFMEDYNPSITQMIYSNDKKISIKIHVIKDINVSFPKEKQIEDNKKYLKIQKLNSICYPCFKNKNLDNEKIKNKKLVRRIKNMNVDKLSSIKEEEEKSKPEYKINDIKKIGKKEIINEKERRFSAFSGGIRSRYLNRLHNK